MNTPVPLMLVVAVALVDPDGRVLIAQRPQGKSMAGLWEFPGGKVEAGEQPEQALIRELGEELGITVKPACLAPFTFASHTYDAFHLLMPLYVCRRWDGVARTHHHAALKWVRPSDMKDYPMPAADLPLIPMLQRSFVKDLASDTSGAAAIEYTLVASAISLVTVTALTSIGTKLSGLFAAVATSP